MAQNKRYYWLKLHEEFFNQPVMKYLRKLPDGETIIIIYLKLLLISLRMDGYIYMEGLFPTIEEEIALILDEDQMSVQFSLASLEKSSLLERGSGEYDLYLTRLPEMIGVGCEGASAERMRAMRERRALASGKSAASLCDSTVTGCDTDVTGSDTEKDKEKKKDSDTEQEQSQRYGLHGNVILTASEFRSLQQQYPTDYLGKIDYFSSYMATTGRHYDSHYLTICQWAKQDELKRPVPAASAVKPGFPDYSCEEGESF